MIERIVVDRYSCVSSYIHDRKRRKICNELRTQFVRWIFRDTAADTTGRGRGLYAYDVVAALKPSPKYSESVGWRVAPTCRGLFVRPYTRCSLRTLAGWGSSNPAYWLIPPARLLKRGVLTAGNQCATFARSIRIDQSIYRSEHCPALITSRSDLLELMDERPIRIC